MIDLIKEWFELTAKANWLKMIDKEVNKYNRINRKLNSQAHIINALLNKYKEIYGEDLRVEEGRNAE